MSTKFRIWSIVFLALLLCGWGQAYAQTEVPPAGSGTAADPWQIATLENLHWLSQEAARATPDTGPRWRVHCIQTQDIDASATASWDGGAGFSPISIKKYDRDTQYVCYDGQGHTIDGLTINRPDTDYVGLFGMAGRCGWIENLGVTNCQIKGQYFIGSVVGLCWSTLVNCHSTGSVTGASNVGGLAGLTCAQRYNSGITNCSSSCSVLGQVTVGGLIGRNGSVTTDCHADGDVTATGKNSEWLRAGGLVGLAGGSDLSPCFIRCYSTGTVTADCDDTRTRRGLGGLVGVFYQRGDFSFVSECFSTSNVVGSAKINEVGGLIGLLMGKATNCYARGSVSGGHYVGGLVGRCSSGGPTSNCYSTGSVSGLSTGGLVGSNKYSSVENSFWDTETSGQSTSAAGTGKTTAEMKVVDTFTLLGTEGLDEPWDFVGDPNDDSGTEDYWDISPSINDGYPHLFLNPPPITNQPPTADPNGPYDATTNMVLADIDPDTLNIQSNGRWVTGYFLVDPDGTALVELDGSGSEDPDEDELTYFWSISGGEEVIELDGVSPAVDLAPGEYQVDLFVHDGTVGSEIATTTISVAQLDLADVDPGAVTLNGVPGAGGDLEGDELMVKFDRQELIESGTLIPEELNELEVGGAISGFDTIMVIDRGNKGGGNGKGKGKK